MNRAAVVVAIGGVPRGTVALVPHELHRLPVHRNGHRPRVEGPPAPSCSGAPSPWAAVWSTQKRRTPCSTRASSSPGAYAHSGSQSPPLQPPKRRRCDAIPVPSWSPRPASVASSGSTAWVADEVQSSTPLERAEGAEEIAAAPGEALGGALVVARRSTHLGGQLRLAPALEAGRVLAVDQRADLVEEADEALARLAAHGLELVAQHRGEPDGDRRAARLQSSSGRYTHATASQSHSSPNGQVPKPST